MSMFILDISCLTTFNLPWFMDLTFQFPMQYCSLQHRTLLPSPVTSITGCCFCFGSIPSFFLELFPHWSPVALGTYWPEEFIFHHHQGKTALPKNHMPTEGLTAGDIIMTGWNTLCTVSKITLGVLEDSSYANGVYKPLQQIFNTHVASSIHLG